MCVIPAEVANIALKPDSCDESWHGIKWFELMGFFDEMAGLETAMFRTFCERLLGITKPEASAKRVRVGGKARAAPKAPSSPVREAHFGTRQPEASAKRVRVRGKARAAPKAEPKVKPRPRALSPASVFSSTSASEDEEDARSRVGTASANVQSDAGNAHWGNEGNERSSWGDAGDANWGHWWHAWNNAARLQAPEANASSSVAQRQAPASLRQRALPDEPHSTIPDTAFLFVFNVSLLLLNGIQDYFGLDYIAKHNVHRLKL